MPFSQETEKLLDAPLDRGKVRTRDQGNRKVSYIEGWWAIAEANRIFGYGGWSSETLDIKCVSEKERAIGQAKSPGWGVTYTCKVRVCTGSPAGNDIVREGCGSGHGIDRDLGQAHESAIKEAETDARKRALMTFGNQFGLALYDKEQANVTDAAQESNSKAIFMQECRKAIAAFSDEIKLKGWWNSEEQKKARRFVELDATEVHDLIEDVKERFAVIQANALSA